MPESVCLALAVRPALCQRLRALTTSPRSRSLCAHVPDGEAEAWEVSGLTAEGRAQAPGAERRPSPASEAGSVGHFTRVSLTPHPSLPCLRGCWGGGRRAAGMLPREAFLRQS